MRTPDFLKHLVITCLVLSAARPSNLRADATIQGRCHVAFHGTSTLHDFSGEIDNVPLEVDVRPGSADGETVNCDIHVESRHLTTHHRKRDENMYKMFRADEFATIDILVEAVPVPSSGLGTSTVLYPGFPINMSICGVTNRIDARIVNRRFERGSMRFSLEFEISLTSFGLKRPTALLGAVRVGDIVRVQADVTLEKRLKSE